LKRSHPPEAEHGPLSPSKWLVRVLGAIVGPATGFLLVADAKLTQRRAIGSQTIRHELISGAVPLQCFLEEFQCCFLISRFGHEALENLAFMIDRPPKVVLLAVDLHKDFVQVPTPVARSHPCHTPLSVSYPPRIGQ